MIVFDFFAGTGSATKAFEDAGHTVIKVELDEYFDAHERDILALRAEDLIVKYGQPDFIWASPPCTTFSVASIGKHWTKDKQPKTESAKAAIILLNHTVKLIQDINPKNWAIENPRGMMRNHLKLGMRKTITYCQYGDTRMKPTDIWTNLNWTPKPHCKNGDSCHEAAPRGSRTGTQGIRGAKLRSMIPYELGKEICDVIHISHNEIIGVNTHEDT